MDSTKRTTDLRDILFYGICCSFILFLSLAIIMTLRPKTYVPDMPIEEESTTTKRCVAIEIKTSEMKDIITSNSFSMSFCLPGE